MRKFSKIKESESIEMEFIVHAKVTLKIKSENSGEAGYLSDSILGSIEGIDNFEILNIEESMQDLTKNEDVK